MFNIFEIAVNDQSVYYLGRIFGNMGPVLPGTGPQLLGAMFQVLNTAFLVLAVFIAVYIIAAGVLLTAHEGSFLGQKMHKMWMPLRLIFAVVGLVPTASGYCIIQIIMMWFVMQGIGAADAVWSSAITYIEKGGAISTPPGSIDPSVGPGVRTLFQALTCQAAAKASYPGVKGSYSYYCSDPNNQQNDAFCSRPDSDMLSATGSQVSTVSGQQFYNVQYNIGPGGNCGILPLGNSTPATVAPTDPNYVSQTASYAKFQALSSILPTLGQIAKFVVDADYAFRSGSTPPWLQGFCTANQVSSNACFWDITGTQPTYFNTNYTGDDQPSLNKLAQNIFWPYAVYPYVGSNFAQDTINLYGGDINNAITQSSGANAQNWQTNILTLLEQSRANGWIFAGGYYYSIASLSNTTVNVVGTATQIVDQNQMQIPSNNGTLSQYSSIQRDYTLAGSIYDTVQSAAQAGGGTYGGGVGGGATSSVAGNILSPITSFLSSLMQGWMSALTVGTSGGNTQINPMIALQQFGASLTYGIEITFGIILFLVFGTSIVGNLMNSVQSAGYTLSAVFTFVVLPILFFIGALLVFGVMLSVYMPLIPYIIFTFAAINWMIGTIEMMVAGPLVAIGVMSPGGSEILGKADPAILLLVNLFLRPTLIVVGMMAGMLLSYVVVSLINAAFLGVVQQINPLPGLVEIIVFMAIYTSLIVAALNKCYNLIHLVPDQVLRWIQGGGQAQFGESTERPLGEAKQAAESMGGTVKTSAEAGMQQGGEYEKKLAGMKEAERKKAGGGAKKLS